MFLPSRAHLGVPSRQKSGPLHAIQRRIHRLVSVGAFLALTAGTALVSASSASAASPTLVGGWSKDQVWANNNIGQMEIYRGYSPGFRSTWAQTGYANRPGVVDYSFNMDPGQVAGASSEIRGFLATTPKNLIVNYFHEPEVSTSPESFRAATRIVANLVHAQNRADGGQRLVEVILMGYTFRPFSGRNAMDWWPGRDASGNNYADIISEDVYSDPQGPNTASGYTNGVNWRTSAQLFDPIIEFASRVGARWSVSELGFLEDSTDPGHKARAITDAVNYAESHGAFAIEYWDSIGRRGDWRLQHSSSATTAFRQAVQAG